MIFRVRKPGAWKLLEAVISPSTVPSAPTLNAVAAADTRLDIAWTAPGNAGGSPITAYEITATPGSVTKTVAGDVLATSLTGLTNGQAYSVTVKAINGVGASAASNAISGTPVAPAVTVRYVSPSGSNANDGLTTGTPWQTLQYALQNAPSPCTVRLMSGTYASFGWSTYTGRTDYVTFTPAAGATITFNGFSVPSTGTIRVDWVAFDGLMFSGGASIRGSHVKFLNTTHPLHNIVIEDGSDDVLIEDVSIGSDGNLFTATNALYLGAGAGDPVISNVTIRRVTIDGVSYVGMNLRNFSNVLVEDCVVANVVRPGTVIHSDGIRTFAGGDGLTIRRTWLHDVNGIGIFFKDGAVSNVKLENLVVGECTGSFRALQAYAVTGMQIINSTFDDNCSFDGTTQSTGLTIFNSIFKSLDSTSAVPSYNFKDYNLIGSGNITPGASGITGLATFADTAKRLTAASLGVNAGVASGGGFSAPSNDRDGNPRPVGVVDMGAYERQS